MPVKKYNTEIIERLKDKYGVGKRYITMSLTGDRRSEVSDRIRNDYRLMKLELDRKLKSM